MSAYNGQQKLVLNIETEELAPNQVRLIKYLNSILVHVLKTDQEEEFFEGSAELMKICASIVKQSNFADEMKANDIPYADQALEFSMDAVTESMANRKVVSYDN